MQNFKLSYLSYLGFMTALFVTALAYFVYLNFLSSSDKNLLSAFIQSRQLNPDTPLPDNEFSAWIAYWDEQRTIRDIPKAKKKLSTVLPFGYRLTPEGEVEEIKTKLKSQIIDEATVSGLKIIPSYGNELDSKRISLTLNNKKLRTKLIDHIASTAANPVYSGIDLDFEEIPEKDKELYTSFVHELSLILYNTGKKLSVTVHARTGEPNEWGGTKGQDLKKLAEHADQIRVMAYDYHYSTSDAGPVTPLEWYEKVIKHSRNMIPTEKLIMGLPNYGYDWVEKKGESVQYEDAMRLIDTYTGKVARDTESQALKGTYTKDGINHVMYFEDKQSIQAKVEIANRHGIYQFSFWRLGGNDEEFWK